MAETNTTNLETTIAELRARNAELEANLRQAKVREKVLAAENEQLHESIKEAIEKRGDMAGELLKAKIKLSILERQSKAWDNYLDET
jgi:rRNA maturation endonuclease Nob1